MTTAKESLEMINDFGTTGYDSLRQLADLNLATWNKMFENQMGTVTTLMETAMDQLKQVSGAKNYQEAIQLQMEMNRNVGETLLGKTRENVELGQQAAADYRAWMESSMDLAKTQFNKVAEKAA